MRKKILNIFRALYKKADRILRYGALAFTVLSILAFSHVLHASNSGGNVIINNATFTDASLSSISTSVKVNIVVPSSVKPTIEFLKYSSGSPLVNVVLGLYRGGFNSTSPFVPQAPPVLLGSSTPIDLTQPVPLSSASVFRMGDPVFIRVVYQDHNVNPSVAETLDVTITDDATHDTEVIRLTETGPNTGVFVGYTQSTGGLDVSYNGRIAVKTGDKITAVYTDSSAPDNTATAVMDITPVSKIFSSITGKAIDGIKITLINAQTGMPATVYGDDGKSLYPSTVTTGSAVSDSSGVNYEVSAGGYRFPYVEPGQYSFKVVLPNGYSAPSTATDATLQALPGGPFALATPGSRMEVFTVGADGNIRIDIPIDQFATALWLQKTAGKDTVAIGDFLYYDLTITNADTTGIARNVVITDRMPLGFRYKRGSVKFNSIPVADPAISTDGRTLVFSMGDMAAGGSVTVRYVVEVAAGASMGMSTNYATAQTAAGVTSNLAKAMVRVKSDFLNTRSVIMGQVIEGKCGQQAVDDSRGVPGVRIFMEDGTFVDSDKSGKFHIEGVTPGTHVVQMDLDSLPKGTKVIKCEKNTRFAGSAYSQFVDVQGGSIWRTDFYVILTPEAKKALAPEVKADAIKSAPTSTAADGKKADLVTAPTATAPVLSSGPTTTAAAPALVSSQTSTAPVLSTSPTSTTGEVVSNPTTTNASGKPEEKKKEVRIDEKEGFLAPVENTTLLTPINAVRVCVPLALTPRLFVDGVEVSAERIGFTMKDEKAQKAIHAYIGVDFGKQGEHELVIKGTDPFGNTRFENKIKVVRSGEIATIRLKEAEGNVADGKTPVRINFELLDSAGRLIPAETDLELRGGTLKVAKNNDAKSQTMTDTVERVHIDKQGNVYFTPVATSGTYRAVVAHNNTVLDAEIYVKPYMRDWILVGVGEGTVGYNTLSGNMEALRESGQEDNIYKDGKLAFYAKGTVLGKWLLTMSYDSKKGAYDNDGTSSLFQTIDPNAYYMLYGDASKQQYDAPSQSKLYLKIERDQFYVLFGDYDTNLTVTELTRYSRRMNGVKAEYQSKYFEANVFGSETPQAYVKDELRGDGTSGLYRLSQKNIVYNSEKVYIVIKDRFRSEIIVKSTPMNRFSDYSIDYDAGTIFFKAPVFSRDEDYNPVFIVVEYETMMTGGGVYTFGGRVGVKLLNNKLTTGATYIREEQVDGFGSNYGLDVKYKLNSSTTVRAEIAKTEAEYGTGQSPNTTPVTTASQLANTTREGYGYLAELDHRSTNARLKIYYRQLDMGFGLGQQSLSEIGTRKEGIDAEYKINSNLSAGGLAYRQDNLSTNAVQDVAEAKLNYSANSFTTSLGLRYANDSFTDGTENTSEQITLASSWVTFDKRLTFRAGRDQSIDRNENTSFPTRTMLGSEFKLTDKIALFAKHEYTQGIDKTETTSGGLTTTPWSGGMLSSSFGDNGTESNDRLFALFGLKQTFRVTEKWSVDGTVDRSQTLKNRTFTLPNGQTTTGSVNQFNPNQAPVSGESENYTAITLGNNYKESNWSFSSRMEMRTADSGDKYGVVAAYVREANDGLAWSTRVKYLDSSTTGVPGATGATASSSDSKTTSGDLRLGVAYRPGASKWIILNRLDFYYDMQQSNSVAANTTSGASSKIESQRIVNNLSVNYKVDNKIQVSATYGAKYAYEIVDGSKYSGYTDLVGVEGRYDLNSVWDIGFRCNMLHSWEAGQFKYSFGPSVGYNVMDNVWLSLGYNFLGFKDKDFSNANYMNQGVFFQFRFKFDQNSVKSAVTALNRE